MDDQSRSTFTELGRGSLIDDMRERSDTFAAREQLEQLVHVLVRIGSDLDLDATLRQVVTAGMELAQAPFGALAVRRPDGSLARFVHEGIDADTVRRIGRLPEGKGVLGAPIEQGRALRLDDLTAHPAAVGYPAHHPPMRALLGVPITLRGNIFGTLYLADDRPTRSFTEADEIVAKAVAIRAAVAIDNAQLFARVRTSADWMSASREITTALLAEHDPHPQPLEMIAEKLLGLTDAEQAIVLVPADHELPADEINALVVATAVGPNAEEVIGQWVPVEDSTTGGVFRSGTAVITESFQHPITSFTDGGQRSGIVMPLRADNTVLGVIAVTRNKDQTPFDTNHLELVGDFARHAAIALTLAAGREQARDLAVLGDRERIAQDLHDQVIQRLFVIGLDLQGTMARAHSPVVVERLNHTTDELQATIDDIRRTIFQLNSPAVQGHGFRQRIHDVVADLTENRDITTSVRMSGPLTAVGSDLAEHAEAVIVEAISNAVRHSGADHLSLAVTVADELGIEVVDDGRGIPADNQRRSGLANLHRRAEQVGGTCEIASPPGGGTRLRWTAPLSDS